MICQSFKIRTSRIIAQISQKSLELLSERRANFKMLIKRRKLSILLSLLYSKTCMSKKRTLVRKLGIVTNPSELDDQDTFFLFVNEAISRTDLNVYIFDANDVSNDNIVRAKWIKDPICLESKGQLDTKTTVMNLSDFDLIFLKKNPPMDKDCSRLLEKLFKEKLISVVWEDETIEKRKDRL